MANNSNNNQSSEQLLTHSIRENDLDARDSRGEYRSRASFDGCGSGLIRAIPDDGSIISNIGFEEWTFTGFSQDMPFLTTGIHRQRHSTSDANQDLASFAAEEARYIIDEDHSQAAEERITHWLDRLPDTNCVTEGTTAESMLGVGSSSEESFGRSVSFNEVNVVLAKRGTSLLKERSQEDWELRRPSEVQEEARTRRSSSQSSWGSNEWPRHIRRGLDKIDFGVIDELKDFKFTSTRRGRKPNRPDSPPRSPGALACQLWPERSDFSSCQGQQLCIFHVHATMEPTFDKADGVQPVQGESSESSCKPAQSRKWFAWWKK